MSGSRMSLEEAFFQMRDKSNTSVKDVSLATGIPENTLYQKASMTTPELQFRASEIVPVMNAFKRFDPLEVMAWACGFMLVKVPRGRAKNEMDLNDYQIDFAKMVKVISQFRKDPTKKSLDEAMAALKKHLQDTANIKAGCDAHANQLELDVE